MLVQCSFQLRGVHIERARCDVDEYGLRSRVHNRAAVAKNVNGTVITSSPGPISNASSASSSASDPEAQPRRDARRNMGGPYFECLNLPTQDEIL